MTEAIVEADDLKDKIFNFAAACTVIDSVSSTFKSLQSTLKGFTDAYAAQVTAETKLAVTMRNTMGAREEDIQSIKDLCSAQQALGVIGDEVQLAGAQKLATYLGEKQSLEQLIPVMNDILAQQYGLNATQENAAQIATMLGKVMEGQVGALSRYGYKFDEAQEQILKYGEEAERAAVLCDVVSSSVGGMNAELAKTDVGKQKQLDNTLGDINEKIGELAQGVVSYVAFAAETSIAVSGAFKLYQGLIALSTAATDTAKGLRKATIAAAAKTKAFALLAAAAVKTKVAALAVAAANKVAAAGAATWAGIQKVLNLVLSANPIGIVIMAIGGLVTALKTAYNKSESFRKIVDKLWEAIKPLATAITDGLAKAFEWLVEKCKIAWQWLKNILGLSGKSVEVNVEVSEHEKSGKGGKKPEAPQKQVSAMNLREVDEEISDTERRLKDTTDPAEIKQLRAYNDQLKARKKILNELTGLESKSTRDTGEKTRLEELNALIKTAKDNYIKASESKREEIRQNIQQWEKERQAIELLQLEAERPLSLTTLEDFDREIAYQQQLRHKATAENIAGIDAEIERLEEQRRLLDNSGFTPTPIGDIKTYSQLNRELSYYTDLLDRADATQREAIQQNINDLTRVKEKWDRDLENLKKPVDLSAVRSIKECEEAISYYQQKQNEATGDEIQNIQHIIEGYEKKRNALQRGIDLPSMMREADEINQLTGREYKIKIEGVGFEALTEKIKELRKMLDDTENPVTDAQRADIEGLISTYEKWKSESVDVKGAVCDAVSSIGNSMSGLGDAFEIPELNVVGIMAQAVATMIQGFAAASAQAASLGPWAWLGFGALGLAQLTAMVTSVKNLPAFANGGIVSGPTVGLIGEYAGASNNPEVVAPLDRLRSMLNPVGEPVIVGGTLRASGRDIVCVLANETRIASKSGRRTNIKL
ncbi:MAG: hypothetical protein HDS68_05740 [Bacteroidales bacterium]|nr:hypothetical protein [Bacteroidales bacterium]